MTRKQIERYADDYSVGIVPAYSVGDFARYQIADAFEAGAQWRINSVWHNNSVRPGEDCDVLVETKHRIIFDRYDTDYNELDSGTDWETEVIRWAYVSDLLPERKEGNNVQ